MDTEKTYTLADLKVWDYSGTALAVIGQPIKHSLSPIMHNAAIAQLSESDPQYKEWAYFRFEIDPEDLPEALELFYQKRFLGLNLTVPHKVMAIDLLKVISDSARAIGAVNTLKWTASGYEGFNTDGYGMSKGIEQGLGKGLNGSDVLILGAGGAARAAVVECLSQNAASIRILNRSKGRLDAMLSSLSDLKGFECILPIQAKEDLSNLTETGICINATSLGLNEKDPLPLDVAFLTPKWAVYDMVYNPQETKLFIEAQRLGCAVKTGLSMLVHQGAKALEIWTGRQIDAQIMHKAGERALYHQVNQ
jgi:shikimate dehydrogenase